MAIEILSALLILFGAFCLYKAGYHTGRADGIEWTRDVYNGKYDNEIMKENE